ncbi:MAG: DUF4123 domain-containing protein [Opitutaceae bacterium]|nr:DUF4123 domain-containing protein [Opitutaceae bacterium]
MENTLELDPAAQAAAERRWIRFQQMLFGREDLSTYAVLDAANIPDLLTRLAGSGHEYACLYRGELNLDLRITAPYLVKLRSDGDLCKWLSTEGWGKNWGIYVLTELGLEALRRHLRGFLRVRDPRGKVLYFRYYDPRVLRVYLPTCASTEIRTVFGSIQSYVCEGEEPFEALEFPVHRVRITPRTTLLQS